MGRGIALPALQSAAVAGTSQVARNMPEARSAQHAQQVHRAAGTAISPPKAPGNNAVIDLLDSDDDSPAHAYENMPAKTTLAAATAAAVAQPLPTNVARAGPSNVHIDHAQTTTRPQHHHSSPINNDAPWKPFSSQRDVGATRDGEGLLPVARSLDAASPPRSFAPPPQATTTNLERNRLSASPTGAHAFEFDPSQARSNPTKGGRGVVLLPALPASKPGTSKPASPPYAAPMRQKHQSAPAGTPAGEGGEGFVAKCVAAAAGSTPKAAQPAAMATELVRVTPKPRTKAAALASKRAAVPAVPKPDSVAQTKPAPKAASAPAAAGVSIS